MKNIILLVIFLLSGSVFAQNNKIYHEKDIAKLEGEYHKKLFSFEKTNVGNMYDLVYHRFYLFVDPDTIYISGGVTSYFIAKEDNLNELTFDLHTELTVDSILSKGENLSFEHENNILTVYLSSSLSLNQIDSLTIWYHGVPPGDTGFGSFIQDYHNNTPIIWTLSEPFGAKDWWPCKQSLVDKIDSIDIIVITPFPNRVASNGVLVSEVTNGDNNIIHWKHCHPITAYLIAISVTNYANYSEYVHTEDGDSFEILNYVYPEDISSIQEQSAELIAVMEFFNEKFILYPYADEKYGHAQFEWGGGMEHQTMSFVENFYISLTTHELAHQWFGDYITCGSWEDIWLNEGFATYLTGLMWEEFYPDYWLEYKQGEIEYIISDPGGSVLCTDTTSVWRIFNGRLSYAKGGMVLHMLRHKLGDSNFFNAIKNYLNDPELANGYAKTPHLQSHFEMTADTSLQEFFNDWYIGEGFPSYTIFWWQDDSGAVRIAIDQSQSHESVEFFEMHLPILFEGESQNKLLTFHHLENSQEFIFDLDFEIENVQLDPEHNIVKGQTLVMKSSLLDLKESYNIYPNPVNDELNIRSVKYNFVDEVLLYSIKGKLIKTYQFEPSTKFAKINTTNINSGIYLVKIYSNNAYLIKKIIIN